MDPKNEFPCFLIVEDFWALQIYLAAILIVQLQLKCSSDAALLHGGFCSQYVIAKLPIHQIFGAIAADIVIFSPEIGRAHV